MAVTINRREGAALINSLTAGVVPRIGLRHIAVGYLNLKKKLSGRTEIEIKIKLCDRIGGAYENYKINHYFNCGNSIYDNYRQLTAVCF